MTFALNRQHPSEPGWYCLGFDRLDQSDQEVLGPQMEGIYEFTGQEWLDEDGSVVLDIYDPTLGMLIGISSADYYVRQGAGQS